MRLVDDTPVKEQLSWRLLTHYRGLLTDDLVLDLLFELGREDADDVAEAVGRHIRDTGLGSNHEPIGKYPPTLAHIERQLETIRKERTQQAQSGEIAEQTDAEDEERNPQYWQDMEVPPEMRARWGLPATIRVRRTECRHCGDTGIARFYYDSRNRRRVWTALEVPDLSAPESRMIRCSTAICTCVAGDRPEAERKTTIRYRGQDREVLTCPQLALILDLAQKRRVRESVDIGQPAPF